MKARMHSCNCGGGLINSPEGSRKRVSTAYLAASKTWDFADCGDESRTKGWHPKGSLLIKFTLTRNESFTLGKAQNWQGEFLGGIVVTSLMCVIMMQTADYFRNGLLFARATSRVVH